MNSKPILILSAAVLVIGLTQNSLFASVNTRMINGTYTVKTVPDDQAKAQGEKNFQDTLTIKDLTFSFGKWTDQGFEPGWCSLEQSRVFVFTCKSHASQEMLLWSGVFQTDTVSGVLIYVDHLSGKILKYTVTGKKN